MSQTRKALGMGLEQLFNSEQVDFNAFERDIVESTPKTEIVMIPVEEIRSNPYQPRIHFDKEALQELADSIKEHGVLEPIIVKKSNIKGYELVAGERRTKASKIAGMETIPAIIKDFNDEEMAEIAILENIQRENLTPIEEAQAYKNFMKKTDLTQEELAKKFGKSRSYITNLLGLLTLPKEVQKDVIEGRISMSHARVLSKMSDEEKILELRNRIINEGLSVREIESISQDGSIPKKNQFVKKVNNSKKHINETIYENKLKDITGSKVKIASNKITIQYDSISDLDRIMEVLNIEIGE